MTCRVLRACSLVLSSVLLLVCAEGLDDHFATWFQEQRQEVYDSRVDLSVTGTVPSHVKGKLVRLGPSVLSSKDKNFTNYIDAFGRVTSWTVDGSQNKAYFQSAILKTQLWNSSEDSIATHITQEKTDPKTAFSAFDLNNMDNTDVNLYKFKGSDNILTFTDFYLANSVHLESLHTLGPVVHEDAIPSSATFSSSHPGEYVDPVSGETMLVNWVGAKTKGGCEIYVYKMGSDMVRHVVGSVEIDFVPYSIHAVSVVGDYVTIALGYVSLDFMKSGITLCLSCSAHDELNQKPTRMLVFSLKESKDNDKSKDKEKRSKQEIRGPFADISIPLPDSFFVFHHINGWLEPSMEEGGGDVLVLDMSAYRSMEGVLGDNVLGNINDILDPAVRDNMPYFPDSVKRVKLDLLSQTLLENVDLPMQDKDGNLYRIDFGTVNPSFRGQTHCIIYAIAFHSHNSSKYEDMGVLKINTCKAYDVAMGKLPSDTATVTTEWYKEGVYVGEPIFVPTPQKDNNGNEDDGTLLVVTKDGVADETVLRMFDARTFQQVAQMVAPFALMFEFHGQFLPSEE